MSGQTPAPYALGVPPGAFPGAGHGGAKAQAVRIAWAVVPVVSITLLSWLPLLVLALYRRTRAAWLAFGIAVGGLAAALGLLIANGAADDRAKARGGPDATPSGLESVPGDIAGVLLIGLLAGVPTYWLVTTRRTTRAAVSPDAELRRRAPGHGWQPALIPPGHRPADSGYRPMPGQAPGYQAGPGGVLGHAYAPGVPPQAGPVPQMSPQPPQQAPHYAAPQPQPGPAQPAPAADPHAARARARLEGLSERLRERDGK
ncbi:hypothetical protein [Yinghuangia seranimata]|uniref:hypothetical protein n=1 Tax=Yinghuangia seranimata TaxID=408067 RepID=UPI00248AD431|nr:hypothetical protein [Yinghuangia seranimata]MDI2126348.1 hypothetical protein [Yinghuangia seranimata]